MNGIVVVDKPSDWTSQDVTARLRRVFGTRRIGHGGTLDPMATGVLPVFVGRATRGVEFFESAEKTYETVLRLGLTTDTEDIWGRVLTQTEAHVTAQELEQALEGFRGEQMQVPPMYSALKVDGRKLCDLARKGREVERKPRPIVIYELTLLGEEPEGFRLRVRCSKGTYIRTLCKDIGQALGCGGCMAALRRTQAGRFHIQEAVPLTELLESPDPETYLRGVDSLFTDCPALTLTAPQERRARNGGSFSTSIPEGRYRCYSPQGEFLMLGQVRQGAMETVKSFFDPVDAG